MAAPMFSCISARSRVRASSPSLKARRWSSNCRMAPRVLRLRTSCRSDRSRFTANSIKKSPVFWRGFFVSSATVNPGTASGESGVSFPAEHALAVCLAGCIEGALGHGDGGSQHQRAGRAGTVAFADDERGREHDLELPSDAGIGKFVVGCRL